MYSTTAGGCFYNLFSASGCGECLIRTNFATNFAETIMKPPKNATDLPLLSYEAEKYLRTFVKSRHLGRFEERDKVAGFICLLFDRSEKQAELIWAHNTQHFCVAYMSTCDTKPKCFISTGKTNGEICVSGVKIKL